MAALSREIDRLEAALHAELERLARLQAAPAVDAAAAVPTASTLASAAGDAAALDVETALAHLSRAVELTTATLDKASVVHVDTVRRLTAQHDAAAARRDDTVAQLEEQQRALTERLAAAEAAHQAAVAYVAVVRCPRAQRTRP